MPPEPPATWPASPEAALRRDLEELGGAGLRIVELDGTVETGVLLGAGVVRIGVNRRGPLPVETLARCDILLSADPRAPRPWVGTPDLDATLLQLSEAIGRQPVAASLAAQVLRTPLSLDFALALSNESIAYSMLLASEGFRAWRAATPVRQRPEAETPRVAIDTREGEIRIRLTRPARRNAFDARMRDELAEALAFALYHPDRPKVVLTGEGPSFSAGGDLDEFGAAADVGWAHMIRVLRSPARLVHMLGDRITVRVQGACVGAGIEVSAAAARLVAQPGASFRLPEVSMGLIPGAGGTASIPRRIGRRRACYMAISGAEIDLATALAWGLVDAVDPDPVDPAPSDLGPGDPA